MSSAGALSLFSSASPKGLSRWKGMETLGIIAVIVTIAGSERTFPLEGNGNSCIIVSHHAGGGVRKDFPVGREWKPMIVH